MYYLKLWLVGWLNPPILKKEAKREKALNLSHVGLGPEAISGTLNMPISIVYRVIKGWYYKEKDKYTPWQHQSNPGISPEAHEDCGDQAN
jgi:hypothetical protein